MLKDDYSPKEPLCNLMSLWDASEIPHFLCGSYLHIPLRAVCRILLHTKAAFSVYTSIDPPQQRNP